MENRAMRFRGKRAVVKEESVCPYCHKRLGLSVVAVIPEYAFWGGRLIVGGRLRIIVV
jgi:Vacuolar sorting protein 39 domain 2